uniref:beta-carotene isomerase D27, chloroplastic-like n=1 Tax=Erigeron canadensis TaxID=72917 RepID=UPI001CB8A7A8|nr:beta-carotene isomerase D27, chloroplastic-like [Erigeron canadensis]
MGTTISSAQARLLTFPARTHWEIPRIFSINGPLLSVLNRSNSVTTKDNCDHSLKTYAMNNTTATTSKTLYHDNWFESLAIAYITKLIQESAGIKNDIPGYKGLVMVSKEVFREFNTIQQRELLVKALEKAIPSSSLNMAKLTPQSKFTRELFAFITTIAFPWLVGPSEVRESEFQGRKEKNVVHIKKCRFLEEANCVGMCTNMCKMSTQEFFMKNFRTPVNMVPNFDDMSCEIIFGQDPPAQEDDPAFKQPCYKLCNVKQKHSASCIS